MNPKILDTKSSRLDTRTAAQRAADSVLETLGLISFEERGVEKEFQGTDGPDIFDNLLLRDNDRRTRPTA
jgi:hypothetical protein